MVTTWKRPSSPEARNGVARPAGGTKHLFETEGFFPELFGDGIRRGQGADLTSPYKQAGWVHACLKAISSAVRQCPIGFWEGDPKQEPEKARPVSRDHPLYALFKDPNAHMTQALLFEAGVTHRKIDGEDFWFLMNASGDPVTVTTDERGRGRFDIPAFIFPVRGNKVEPVTDKKTGNLKAWRYQTGTQHKEADWRSVIHFRDYDPDNPMRGLGDVAVCIRDLNLEYGAQRYAENMMLHSGEPGGIITLDDVVDPDEERRMEEEATEKLAGIHNHGRWAVISGKGIKYVPAKFGPRDMQWTELLNHVMQKVTTILGVPLPVLGILEEATFSNYATAVTQFWQGGNGVLSLMASIEDAINGQFLPRLKGPASRLTARFDTSKVDALQDDQASKYELAQKLAQGGVGLNFDEAAKLVGLTIPATELGGVAYMPMALTTAEATLAVAEATIENPDPDQASGARGGDTTQPLNGAAKSAPPADHIEDKASLGRRKYWQEFEKAVLSFGEAGLKKKAVAYLRSYERAQIKRLERFAEGGQFTPRSDDERSLDGEKASADDFSKNPELLNILFLDLKEWIGKLVSAVEPELAEIIEAASLDIASQVGVQSFGGGDPWAADFLNRQSLKLAEGVNSTLAKQVKTALVNALREEQTVGTLQQIIQRLLPELRGSLKQAFKNRAARASTIARTESGRASSGARFEMMQRGGVEQHEWITSGDLLVRQPPEHDFNHVELDGAVVELGSSFPGHPNLKYPLDPAAPVGDVVNCRCAARPVLKE